MITRPINNPRKSNGDFGNIQCDVCQTYSGAYIELNFSSDRKITICKSCLLRWTDQINTTVLQDAFVKGRLKGDNNV